jgi:chorismate mutase/prephenate dehydratase
MNPFEAELKTIRDKIDQLDKQLIEIVNARASCAKQVAEVKQREYEDALSRGEKPGGILFYRPEREAQVLRRVMDNNPGPMDDAKMALIIREVMSSCLALEQPMQVAYLGPEGTFTQAAALKHFGGSVIAHPQASIAQIFAKVEAAEVNYGVVPVENSTEGMVSHTLDNFVDSPLRICGEVELPIDHHLLVSVETGDKIEVIKAHPQALAQCRLWLDSNYPGIERQTVSSNGEGARLASMTKGVAAIAGEVAEHLYGLQRLHGSIQDLSNNTTRFLIIGREEVAPSGKDKTSIIVSTHNRPGALFKLLEPFEQAGIMLTRIDTRPSRTEKWAYMFFMEFEGHKDDSHIAEVLAKLESNSLMIKIMGSYPRAVM